MPCRRTSAAPKVDVAADHAKSKNPDVHFRAIRGKAGDAAAKAAMSAATVILGCGDNDGLRKIANEAGIRYGVPYIDLGCDIQMDGDRLEAGGQVRVVVPGETACLVCCGGFDPAKAALDLLADDQRAVYEQRGYLIGDRNRPTPSVATLNADGRSSALRHSWSPASAICPLVVSPFRLADWKDGCCPERARAALPRVRNRCAA